MNVAPTPAQSSFTPTQLGGASAHGTAPANDGMFHRVLDQFLGHIGQQQARSEQAVQELAMGHTDNLHSVVLEVSKADLAFRLFLEIRNRLSDAYQEIMRMQV